MKHLEKPIREVFADICDNKLTNLEIDAFIKKSTDDFKLPKLKRLIIDYERYIQKERAELLIYFEFMYGDRDKFNKNGKIAEEETLNKIIAEYKKKYKDAPEIIHSGYDSGSQEITDFSPFIKEFSSESSITVQYGAISLHSQIATLALQQTEPIVRRYIWKFAPVIMSRWTLMRLNSKTFIRIVDKLKKQIFSETPKENEEAVFIEGLKLFLDSTVYHFNVKLHTLYKNLKMYGNQIQNISEPSTQYKPNSPERKFSPKKCAQDFINDAGYTKYPEHVIEFVMARADKCDYDNIANLIREIRDDPECPGEIKDENKDSKAERKWINYFYKKNKIDKGNWKKKE